MKTEILSLSRFGDLLYMLTWRDIHIRYKQSVMGFLWAILTPSMVVGAGVIVRIGVSRYSGQPISTNDLASVMVRAVAWTFFITSLRFGTNSLLSNIQLVTKVAFPKEIFPVSAVLSSLFDFSIAGFALLIALVVMGWLPSFHVLWTIPLMAMLVVFTAGLTMLLSAANLFFRDVKYIVDIILNYAIFFTPVLYDISFVGRWKNIVMLNPVAPVMEGLSNAVVDHVNPDPYWTTYTAVVSVVLFVYGYWQFKHLEYKFAETI